ncbi:MAG: carboxypeptidase-like regulatory domain-containing protein [Candidatus Krumholzibacteria bacterium]|nr:carboxypeptidase-like regulatory domain-containing protein [Candidatus Krumholzibacteria bacterium]
MKHCGTLALMLVLSCLVFWQGCSDSPEQPKTGTVSALVIDGSLGPVADVEITLTPMNLVSRTDDDGRALFEVPAGDYFVDAKVCCAGPGFINYHLPVTVRSDRTVRVELRACLVCL